MKLKKWLIGLSILVGVLYLLFKFIAWPMMQKETKKISPQRTAVFQVNNFDLKIDYSSPSKKGRVIFGELVPFNTVWRTGANEPTTLETKTNIKIIDKELPAGIYSIWTIPKKESWSVIFNSEVPEWGVTLLSGGKETTRNSENDVITIEVPVTALATEKEAFDISFEASDALYLSLAWDKTAILIPINQ